MRRDIKKMVAAEPRKEGSRFPNSIAPWS